MSAPPISHAPTLRVEKPCDEVGQSGFSAAGSPYKRNGLPRLDGERYIVQRVFLPIVAVAYMFQANAVAFRLAAGKLSGRGFSCSTASIRFNASPTIMASSLMNMILVSVVPITGVMII